MSIFDPYMSQTPTFGGVGASDDIAGWSFGGSSTFGNDIDYTTAAPLTGGIVGWASDHAEQARLGGGYPDNGKPWYENFSALGATRLIDSAVRSYAVIKGSQAATYAGQNGLTYTNGRGGALSLGGGLLPLLLIGGALLLLTKK